MNTQDAKYQKAKKRVSALKDFYTHLIVYLAVNLMLFSINMFASPDNLWFFWPLMGWGIAVVLHALSVFNPGIALGADWEQKKIQELMDKE